MYRSSAHSPGRSWTNQATRLLCNLTWPVLTVNVLHASFAIPPSQSHASNILTRKKKKKTSRLPENA